MALKKTLRKAGYDLIDSPMRNHRLLQLWKKDPGNPPVIYYQHVDHALAASSELVPSEDPALSINHKHKQDYKFNIGITVLDNLLTAIGLGNLGLSLVFNGGKEVTISYGKSKTMVVPQGNLEQYLFESDFSHPNKLLLSNANSGKILLISGVLIAQDLRATIRTQHTIDASVEANLNKLTDGRATFTKTGDSIMEMTSEDNAYLPIAVQAHRLDWDNGEFDKMKLITDNRNFF